MIPIVEENLELVSNKLEKRQGTLKIRGKNGDHSDRSITKINKNTEKGPGDLRTFAVTQYLVKDYQFE